MVVHAPPSRYLRGRVCISFLCVLWARDTQRAREEKETAKARPLRSARAHARCVHIFPATLQPEVPQKFSLEEDVVEVLRVVLEMKSQQLAELLALTPKEMEAVCVSSVVSFFFGGV